MELINWKAEFEWYAGSQKDFTLEELREQADDIGVVHKGLCKMKLRLALYRELGRRSWQYTKSLEAVQNGQDQKAKLG